MPATALPKRPTRLQIWIRGVRALSLVISVIPVLLGGGLALIDRGFDGWTFLITLITVMLLRAGTYLINDYYDYIKGADLEDSFLPANGLQLGMLTPRQVHVAGLVCYLVACVLGSYLVHVGGTLILVLGVIGVLAGYFYSGSRYALAYHRLGEVTVFLLTGPLLVLGSYYVMVRIPYLHVFLHGIAFGLLSAAALHINNMRDMEHDRKIGKHTLATWLGQRKSKWLYAALLLLPYLMPILLWEYDLTPGAALLSLLTFPLALKNIWDVAKTTDQMEMNLELGLTYLLLLLFGILNVFGLFLYYFMQQ
ncbi:MAG: 1,4-dihydroxy-2-naphthoate octaprenyltransferase [Tumebacillaceae bacterium]